MRKCTPEYRQWFGTPSGYTPVKKSVQESQNQEGGGEGGVGQEGEHQYGEKKKFLSFEQ